MSTAVEERPLSASELAFALPGIPMVMSQTITGDLDTAALSEAVAELSILHPVLTARFQPSASGLVLRRGPSLPPPALQQHDTDTAAGSVDAPFTLGAPLLRVVLSTRDDGSHRLALVLSHAIGDGTSVGALWAALWECYAARVSGRCPDLPAPALALPQPVECLLAERFTAQDLEAFLARRATQMQGLAPATIVPLAAGPDGPGPQVGVHLRRVELNTACLEQLSALARSARITPYALLIGIVLASVRTQIDKPGPVTLSCASAVDIRSRITPPVSPHQLVMAVAVPHMVVEASPDADPVDLAHDAWRQLRTCIADGSIDRLLAATPQLLDEVSSASVPTVGISSVSGRITPSLPALLTGGPLYTYSYAPGPLPLVYFSDLPGPGMAITLVHPRAWFTARQCRDLGDAVSDTLARVLKQT